MLYYSHFILMLMDVSRIQDILNESSAMILSTDSFTGRLLTIYRVLDDAFPKSSLTAAILGPITSMGDYMERAEIEPLLHAVYHSSQTGVEFLSTDSQINKALDLVYRFAKQ